MKKNHEKLPAKIKQVVKECSIKDLSKAEAIAANYAPLMAEVNDKIKLIKKLKPGNEDDAKAAKRIRIDLGKVCARSKDQNKIHIQSE